MTSPEWNIPQVWNTAKDHFAAVAEMAIVKDANPRSPEDLDRGDVATEVSGQRWQSIAGTDTEMVPSEWSC
jgi:hypothetical protein